MITKENLKLKSKIIQQPGNIVSDMDGEKVMLNIEKGKYYSLGQVGGFIWSLINKPITVGELVTMLMAEYDVDQAECEQQVLSFCSVLYSEELIKII